MHQEHNARRAREQWGWRAGVVGEAATGLRAQARYLVCRTMSHKPEPKPTQPLAVREYGGPGLVGVRAEVARMQADTAPQPPLPASSATSVEVSSPSSPESPETVRREGPQATGRQRGEGAAAGTGEGGDRGGQAEASGGRAEEVAQGAGGQGEGQGQQAAEGPRADPFNIADVMAGVDMGRREWRDRRESVVADILEVSEDEGEGAWRMAMEGGPGQPWAPNVPAAAMKSILPEVRRQEEGKGGRGQQEAGAAGSGDSSVSAGGRGRTGKGGKGQAGTSGAVHAKGHQAGKGGIKSGRGRQWPQPQRSFRQSPPRLPPQVSAAVRAEEERQVRRQQAARYEALAHPERQRRRRQPPEQGPDTIYWLEMEPGRTGSGRQGGLEGSRAERGGQPSGLMRREVGQAEQSSAAAEGHRGQQEGEQERGSQRSGHTGSAVQGKGAGQVEGGKGKQSGHGTQGKGARHQGLQGKGHGKAGLHGVGGKGHGATGRQAKGQGKESGHGYMGSPVFPGKKLGWWGGVVPPAVPPIVPPFPPPPYPAMGMMYPPPPAYQGMQPQAHKQQRPQARGTAWGAQEGKGEEHRRAWERLGEAERSLREREARVMGAAGRADERRTEGTNRPQGGEAQAVEELQRAWADHRRRQESVERTEREGGRQEEGRGQEGTPLVPFRQPAIPPEQEGEMQERAWRQIRGEAAKLAERDREVAARERRVREEEEAMARGAHRVLPDPEGDTPSTDVEGRSPSGKRAREEEEEAGHERGKRRKGKEQGAGEAEGAPRPASPSPEPTPTDWDSESPPPRQYAPPPVRRGPGTFAGWTAGEVAELARYVNWAGKTRGRREKRGTRPFSNLVGRAGKPRERGPDMDEGRWRRMLGEALPGVSLDCPQEKGKKSRVRMLR